MSESAKMSGMNENNEKNAAVEPRIVRLGFTKHGPIIFTSHLDLQRTMMRILARADLPLWYTQGFNPHAKLVFALPLPLGCASECELMDIRFEGDMPCEEILRRMRGATVPGLEFTSCYPAKEKFAGIASADYTITLRLPGAGSVTERELADFLAEKPIMTVKKTKSGEAEVDIAPLIRAASVSRGDGSLVIDARLAAGSTDNLSPELLMSVILARFGVRARRSSEGADYSIVRREIYDAEGKKFR